MGIIEVHSRPRLRYHDRCASAQVLFLLMNIFAFFFNTDVTVEVGMDALLPSDTTTRLFDLAEDLVVQERLILESGCIVLTVETGSGNNSTPVLLLETDIDMQVFDWSSKVTSFF